jgi:hypothetical protein
MTQKKCAPRCTISCVHKVAAIDFWRDPQTLTADLAKVPDLTKVPEPLVQVQTMAD